MKLFGLVMLLSFSFNFALAGEICCGNERMGYQNLSAVEKQKQLWANVANSEWSTLPKFSDPLSFKEKWACVKALVTLGKSFSHQSDELPEGRIKVLHPYGSVAKVNFVADVNSPLTGVFQGALGLMRISLASAPSETSFTPGLAMKFLIDGEPSVNIHVMEKLSGQGTNKNVFAREFTNILPTPESKIFKFALKYFELFVDNASHLKVSHLARRKENGVLVDQPVAPYQLILVPTKDVQYDENSDLDFREELARIPAGTQLYDVWVKLDEKAERIHVGVIYSSSAFVASEYGDKLLYFQHSQ